VPCRISVFSGRKREKSPCENPPNGDFGGVSHCDLSPRQAKIRQTVAENATHGMSRTFVWRGKRSPCENTISGRKRERSPRENPPNSDFSPFSRGAFRVYAWRGERSQRENPQNGDLGGFSRGDLSPRQAKIRHTGGEKTTHENSRTFVWRVERSPCENTKNSPFGVAPFRPENTIIRNGTTQPPYNWEDGHRWIYSLLTYLH